MGRLRTWMLRMLILIAAVGFVILTGLQGAKAQSDFEWLARHRHPARSNGDLRGGPHGVVRDSRGTPVYGIMVQLISQQSSIRTTVYTNPLGKYEFPKLDGGEYVLRIPRPLEFRRFQKDPIRIEGATLLEDIVLERVSDSQLLPPDPDIVPQITGAEWLFNMPGTAKEKTAFLNSCGGSCHTFQNQFRARFAESDWRKLLDRMVNHNGRLLIGRRYTDTNPFTAPVHAGLELQKDDVETVVKWLSRIRGPEAENPPLKVFPRPTGRATRAIITEYELPWLGVHIHDVGGDPAGNIWFSINRSPFIGKLDPKTGKVTSYRTPRIPTQRDPKGDSIHPGNHWIQSDKDGVIWYSDTWASLLGRFDPRAEKFNVVHIGVHGNVGLSPKDGSIWRTNASKLIKFNPETGKRVKEFPLKLVSNTYGNFLSWDGRYFGGGGNEGIVWFDTQTEELREIPPPPGKKWHGRGGFDPEGNVWVGSKFGQLVKYDPKNNVATEYTSPTPHVNFYGATADKNGDVWAGELHGGRVARFNPRTEQWTEYVLPTWWSLDWQAWVDNSTDPVTYWYGDQYGYIVRIQPLD